MELNNSLVFKSGISISEAEKVVIMLHGRGARPHDIVSLEKYLKFNKVAILAPHAENNTWYPYSFMEDVSHNQPALDKALKQIDDLVKYVLEQGKSKEDLFFLGFSQGACLSLEYTCRNADKYAGIIAFTGGLIGKNLIKSNYVGDFHDTNVLITTSNPDPHVPINRVEESLSVLEDLGANVTLKVFDGKSHSIQMEEIDLANGLFFNK